jgi:hypothetical protein
MGKGSQIKVTALKLLFSVTGTVKSCPLLACQIVVNVRINLLYNANTIIKQPMIH